MNHFYFNIFIIISALFLHGCASNNVNQTSVPQEKLGNNDGFISASMLTENEIDELWQVVIDTCFNENYSVKFNDRKSKNISCESQTENNMSTYLLKVKFVKDGIKVDSNSNSIGDLLVGGYASNRSKDIMTSALDKKLKELRSSKNKR